LEIYIMDTATSKNKGIKGGAWRANKEIQEERDGKIIGMIEQYRVVRLELILALLDLPRTKNNLNIIDSRLQKLSEYAFHKIIHDGLAYNVTLDISRPKSKEQKSQLAHYYMASKRFSTLERVTKFEQRLDGRELWRIGGNVVFDDFVKFDS